MPDKHIANVIESTDKIASYDAAAKKLLSYKPFLAHILKETIEQFRDVSVDEIVEMYIEGMPTISAEPVHKDEAGFVEGTNTEDSSINEGKITFDIKFNAIIPNDTKIIEVIINLEIQKNYYTKYPLAKRGVYYGSRMISSQYGTVFTKSDYDKIKPVYSIWICPNTPVKMQNTISRIHFTKDSIVGNVTETKKDYDLINIITICLGGRDKEHYEGILKMLDVLFSSNRTANEKKSILSNEFGINMTNEVGEEMDKMCDLGLGVYEEGVEETAINSIAALMDSMNLSIDESMQALKIPEDKREKYKEAILGVDMLV